MGCLRTGRRHEKFETFSGVTSDATLLVESKGKEGGDRQVTSKVANACCDDRSTEKTNKLVGKDKSKLCVLGIKMR